MHNARTFDPAKADLLEDPDRLRWLPPSEIIDAIELRQGENVADIGAGSGYFAFPIAEAVAPGRVFAVDLQSEMLDRLRARLGKSATENIIPVAGTALATTLAPASSDLVLFANVWHELDDHEAVLAECARILVPYGRIAIVDWRPEASPPPGPPAAHRLAAADVRRTLESSGWKVKQSVDVAVYHYLLVASR